MRRPVHVVRAGERLTEIAARYGLSTEEIVEANPHKPAIILENVPVFTMLTEGEVLALPAQLVYP